MRISGLRFLASAVVLLVLGLKAVHAADASSTTIAVRIPKNLPLGLRTVVSGKIVGDDTSRIFQVEHPGLTDGSVLAQREADGDRVLFFATLEKAELRGRTLSLTAVHHPSEDRVAIIERGGGYEFLDGSRPVMFYQRDPKTKSGLTRAGYVHPLYGLDGNVLTQSFPRDHIHHQGIFWAWHQLWVGEQRAGDPWVGKDFLAVVKDARVVEQGPLFATLKALVHWTSPRVAKEGRLLPIVEESTFLRVFRANDGFQTVDFDITLRPLLPGVRIGGSEDAKGYSGFTVRVRPPRDMVITDIGGPLSEDRLGQPSPWADVSGQFGDNGRITGLAILTHPDLAEFPPRWLLRHYGMQNVLYPGRDPVSLSPDKPLRLRHRLLIHRGDARRSRVADHQRAFESE